ncbi:MAG: hypothetical protein ACI39G_04945 [Pseudoramibacter sp.]
MAYLLGIYPFTHHTDKQLRAMEEAGVPIEEPSVYDMVYDGLMQILPE